VRGDPSFENAVEQAEKGHLHVAQWIWRQIYEDRKRQRDKASKEEQARAARNLAAIRGKCRGGPALVPRSDPTGSRQPGRLRYPGRGGNRLSSYIALTRKASDEREVAVGLSGLGDVLVAESNLPAARQVYEDSRDIRKHLAEANPGHAGRQVDLAVSHERMGDIAVRLGYTEEALKVFQTARNIYGKLLAPFPGHPQFLLGSVVPDIRFGRVDARAEQGIFGASLRCPKSTIIFGPSPKRVY